ncbi:MAG: hypothetical protein ACKOTF_16245, partial [Opitutaceae bacterium]
LSYQWSRDGAAIPGATQSAYSLASATAMGFYGVTVKAAPGSTVWLAGSVVMRGAATAVPPTTTL